MHFSETAAFWEFFYKNDNLKKGSNRLKLNDISSITRLSGLAKKHSGMVTNPRKVGLILQLVDATQSFECYFLVVMYKVDGSGKRLMVCWKI
jgi:hypothetical protein